MSRKELAHTTHIHPCAVSQSVVTSVPHVRNLVLFRLKVETKLAG